MCYIEITVIAVVKGGGGTRGSSEHHKGSLDNFEVAGREARLNRKTLKMSLTKLIQYSAHTNKLI